MALLSGPAVSGAINDQKNELAKLASEIGGAWTYWQTGIVPLDTIALFDLQRVLIVFAVGALMIILVAIVLARRRRRAVSAD